jgi:hypothetical protein
MIFDQALPTKGHHIWRLAVIFGSMACCAPSTAQKLVDPNNVAPEYRAAAEKRRAEQIKLMECNKKAGEAKIVPRDRAAYISHCLDDAPSQ